jgi:hypothetical protein
MIDFRTVSDLLCIGMDHGFLSFRRHLATLFAAALSLQNIRCRPSWRHATIGLVPWNALKAGDRVQIHYRSESYRSGLYYAVAPTGRNDLHFITFSYYHRKRLPDSVRYRAW